MVKKYSYISFAIYQVLPPAGGGGYLRLVGRLRGIDPLFKRYLSKIVEFRPHFGNLENLAILDPYFSYFRAKM